MDDLKTLKVKNSKETAKDRRNWRDVAQKAKTHNGLDLQMMMMMMMVCLTSRPSYSRVKYRHRQLDRGLVGSTASLNT